MQEFDDHALIFMCHLNECFCYSKNIKCIHYYAYLKSFVKFISAIIFFLFPCRICMPSIFSTMSQNHLRLRSWAILSTPSGPSTRCMDLQKPQLRWVILYCFGHLFEFSFNSKMSSLCVKAKNKITEHYKSQQLTALIACFMHYIIQCNALCIM